MIHQAKNFFYTPKVEQSFTETGTEIKFQLVFLLITSLFYGLLFFFYATRTISDTFILSSEYGLLVIYAIVIVCYFLIKVILYTIVNNIFFNQKKNLHFLGTQLFVVALEGLFMFPLVLLLTYFQLSMQNAINYCIFILSLAKILTFYKSYIIFFKQKGWFLQIILYFCALEMIPLALLWGGLLDITSILKVNY